MTKITKLRLTLQTGASVFAVSAILLLTIPALFLELLALQANPSLEWSMRMISITLIALVGNMWSVAKFGTDRAVLFSSRVMAVSATLLGIVTLLLPVPLTLFALAYAGIGFGFGATYLFFLAQKN